ncbi:10978_t:CDS:2, partial [Racocetra fulgida]
IRQNNGSDCGVAVIAIIRRIREKYSKSMEKIELEKFDFDKGFDKDSCKKWLDIGLKTRDYDCAYWLKIIKKQKELIEKFLSSEKLREQFKQYGLCFECHQPNTGTKRRYESRHAFNLHLVPENAVNEMNVALKILNNSQDVTTDFLREVTSHKLFDNMSLSKFNSLYITKCHGISQDPATENYIIVIDYMRDSNLREFLRENYRELKFVDKLNQFFYIVSGLEYIHEQNLVHRDFHPGNILSSSNGINSPSYAKCYITDLGLSRPANENNKGKIYGVLPYVAPEALQGQSYSQASDIYSSGMIAYEIFSGCPPYSDLSYNHLLALRIYADPSKRPTAKKRENIELSKLLSKLYQQLKGEPRQINAEEKLREIKHELFLEFCKKHYKHNKYASLEWEVQKAFSELLYPSISKQLLHSQSVYTSRLLDFPSLPQPQNNPSKEWQTSTLLELRIKGIEEEITVLKVPLKDDKEGELVNNFVKARKKMIKDKNNKKAKKEAGELEEQLEAKGLATEDIEKLIKHCEE